MELTFFVVGVLPYWYTLALPQKSTRYWLVLCWCSCVWSYYLLQHGAWSGVINNAVEFCLAAWGLARTRRSRGS